MPNDKFDLIDREALEALAVQSDDAVLASIGLRLDGPGAGDIQAACARIARRIHDERIRVVGFVPSNHKVAVPPVLVHLGLALTDLTGATVAVVDANVRYPGLSQVAKGHRTDHSGEDAGLIGSVTRGHDESAFSTRWLRGSLALLSSPRVEKAGEVVPQLARVLSEGSDLFAHVLVDLTGFELLGEHASAAGCMDAVAVVGQAHHSREQELVELARSLPSGRFLGVLLVG